MKSKKTTRQGPTTVITTHTNADFDAMASMLAAQKLYPDAVVVFPGSQERNLRNFFVSSLVYLFNMADIRDIDLDTVRRLVLVDTRQAGRIGPLAELLHRNEVEIHIYDHHPSSPGDIAGDYVVHRITGATTTILTGILRDKGIEITAEEATVLGLGIYEDTGSFTFGSTTPEDFHAAAYLLSKGANLGDIAGMTIRELNPKQIGLLNEMIQAARHYLINGVDVVVTTISTDDYVTDFAFLVQKMVKMERLDAMFAVAAMANKIYIVARSRIPDVDVSAVIGQLGGGGHPFAASAAIRGKPLAQVEQRLMDLLYQEIHPRRLASELMSTPPIKIDGERTCREAQSLLTRYNINALLVTTTADDRERLAGIITRQIIEKAIHHQLDTVAVREFMLSEFETVAPTAELLEIQDKILDSKQRLLPVVEEDRIVGVVTRTDLLNTLVRSHTRLADEGADPFRKPLNPRTRNIRRLLKERLSGRLFSLLETIGQAADAAGFPAYVVGGFVRDLFLYRTNEDVDIVIEGDAIAFARIFARDASARVHAHEKFGTAVVAFPDGFKIDMASARMEYYKFPAALPTVEMSSIKLDLYRRDFTINTLAIQLNGDHFGTLIDFFSGQKDIKEKTVRVLHNLSFVEDPTRVFRAIRFEQRFGFSIGKLTSGLIEMAVKMDFFKRLSGRRVFSELKLILSEENPPASIRRLNEWRLLPVIHPSISLDTEMSRVLESTKKVIDWYDLLFLGESYMKWAVYFMVLIRHCDQDTSLAICDRFELAPRYRKLFGVDRHRAERCLLWLERNRPERQSVVFRRLTGFQPELLLYMMAIAEDQPVQQHLSIYIARFRHISPFIGGADLIQMGFAPGPVFREIFEAVKTARIDGIVQSKAEELAWVRARYAPSPETPSGKRRMTAKPAPE